MQLANIIGLLGLISIIVLIIIYIIKPNFQQKYISSTYVWQLSLRYKKKTVPINKLRNILLIICQVLILAACALILAQPIVGAEGPEQYNEKIIVIESSAGMRAVDTVTSSDTYNETRFERAVVMAHDEAKKAVSDGGAVSVILAGDKASLLIERATKERDGELDDVFSALVPRDSLGFALDEEMMCSYSAADIEGAMALAEDILAERPLSEVILYTATDYYDKGKVSVVNVALDTEWNVAILGGSVSVTERLYMEFSVDIAVYGRSADIELGFEVTGVNGRSDRTISFDGGDGFFTECEAGKVYTVTLDTGDFATGGDYLPDDEEASDSRAVQLYNYARVYIKSVNRSEVVNDSIQSDNSYYFYGGNRPTLNIQYYSSTPTVFTQAVMSTWTTTRSSVWNIVPTEVPIKELPKTSGYDIYIFEHVMPTTMPEDGVVMLLGPLTDAPGDCGLTFEREVIPAEYDKEVLTLTKGAAHKTTDNITAEEVEVTSYMKIVNESGDYEELLYCNDDPVALIKNTATEKIFVLGIDIHMSNITMLYRFSLMMADVFDYFFPATVDEYIYEVGENAELGSMSGKVTVSHSGKTTVYTSDRTLTSDPDNPGADVVHTDFPAKVELFAPGRYSVEQQFVSGAPLSTNFFVKIPAAESNTDRHEITLANPTVTEDAPKVDLDLIVYFAATVIALLFAEWLIYENSQN